MSRKSMIGVACLAAATLLLETTLTRLLAVGQFYHFAFLVVSLALLGFGASGSLLSLSPRLRSMPIDRLLALCSIGFLASVLVAYSAVNSLPFDSYSIAWDRRQILYFFLYYLALTLPFLCSGLAIGAALTSPQRRSHLVYSSNLVGSALGALLAPLVLWLAGVPGAVLASCLIGLLPVALYNPPARGRRTIARASIVILLGIGVTGFLVISVLNFSNQGLLGMVISPYKSLSYARQYPGSHRLFGRWNAFSRLDIMAEAGVRLLPGLSYSYPGSPPPQHGLYVDADTPQPVSLVSPHEFEAAGYLPEALAFSLRPQARVLVLEPGAGLSLLQSLAGGASHVTAVSGNPLIPSAVAYAAPVLDIFSHPQVNLILDPARVYLRRSTERYEIVFFPLTDSYRPVTSGAYSLAETYLLTIEAFQDALAHLAPQGMLVVTRWLQTPPSECIRLTATLVEALEAGSIPDASTTLVAYRGIQTYTLLVKPDGWRADELEGVRSFTQDRKYDLVWAPDISPQEINRYNRLPQPVYFEAISDLLTSTDRSIFYDGYPFAITPTTDDHPFFFHFFTWRQTPEILATLGRTWQPFGGSGYFVLIALLALALFLSATLILTPLAIPSLLTRRESSPVEAASLGQYGKTLGYFALLGMAFLFIEIPLIQRWILLLGQPTYAFAATVLALLLLSGLGSASARAKWLPKRRAFLVLVILTWLTPFIVSRLTYAILGWPLLGKALAAVISLAPLAFLMGLPFPFGLARLEENSPGLVPWAWAVNGCVSVIAAILSAILSLGSGFTLVFWLGSASYAGAFLIYWNWESRNLWLRTG